MFATTCIVFQCFFQIVIIQTFSKSNLTNFIGIFYKLKLSINKTRWQLISAIKVSALNIFSNLLLIYFIFNRFTVVKSTVNSYVLHILLRNVYASLISSLFLDFEIYDDNQVNQEVVRKIFRKGNHFYARQQNQRAVTPSITDKTYDFNECGISVEFRFDSLHFSPTRFVDS